MKATKYVRGPSRPSIDGASCTAVTARSVCPTSSSTSSASWSTPVADRRHEPRRAGRREHGRHPPEGGVGVAERPLQHLDGVDVDHAVDDAERLDVDLRDGGRRLLGEVAAAVTDVDERGEVLAEHRERQGRSRPRSVEVGRRVGEQLVAALELLHGDGDVALLQRRGGPPEGPLAVAQVAVGLDDGDDRAEDGDAGEDAEHRRRSGARSDGPADHGATSPVTTMTAAISAVTRADRPNRHDGSQRNSALIVSAADSARPAGRLEAPPADHGGDHEGDAGDDRPRQRRGRDRGEAGGRGERPPRARRARPRDEAGEAGRQHDVGRSPRRRVGAGSGPADGRGHRDHGDDDRVALGDPVAADPLRRPRRG